LPGESGFSGGPDERGAYDRKAVMRLAAVSGEQDLAEGLEQAGLPLELDDLRPPEIGLAMVRGRIGGDGRPFNLGEMTVTRAAVRSQSGFTGFAYLEGRCPRRARLAAIVDACWQDPASRAAVERYIAKPAERRLEARRRRQAEQAAATKVDFFTMVRGED